MIKSSYHRIISIKWLQLWTYNNASQLTVTCDAIRIHFEPTGALKATDNVGAVRCIWITVVGATVCRDTKALITRICKIKYTYQ